MLQKKSSINFYKTKTKFRVSLRFNGDESYLSKTEICKFKVNDNVEQFLFRKHIKILYNKQTE